MKALVIAAALALATGGAMAQVRLRIDKDRFGVALVTALVGYALFQGVTLCGQQRGRVLGKSIPLERERVGHPLVVDSRRLHRRHHRHAKIDHVADDLEDRIDDRGTTRAPGHEEQLAVAEHERGRH